MSSASSTAAPHISAASGRPGPLIGLRAVELADGVAGPYVAKLLGDYGADVVKIERAAGDSSRMRGPFPGDVSDPEASGLFLYLNTNKRSVTLDLTTAAGRETLDGLLAAADFFVTNLPVDALKAAGLEFAALRAKHPRLIITSVAPFGNDGPAAQWRGADIVSAAMGGITYSTPGIPDAATDLYDEPPLHAGCFAAGTIAGVVSAAATMAALQSRNNCGEGCLVEVSEQAAVGAMQQRDIANASYIASTHTRLFSETTTGRMPNFYLPCKDGWVAIPAPLEDHWQRLVQAMGNPAWALTPEFNSGPARTANCVELQRRLIEWTMTVDSDELYRVAQELELLVFPFYPVRKMVASEHAKARNSVVAIEVGGRPAGMPAAPVQMRGSPWSLRRGAPRLGEHTAQVIDEWLSTPPASARVPAAPLEAAEASDTRPGSTQT
jgi:crotonobetainyl-CoA:carnitine CoA-transferase CaiB-like acyl-CoA transferase